MLLAQEITVVTQADPWMIGTSLAAVAIAVTSLVWTWRQGLAIRNIETREHEWQSEDRISAYVQVTGETERHLFMTPDGRKHRDEALALPQEQR